MRATCGISGRRAQCLNRAQAGERDRDAFIAALIEPPEPSERLQRALAEHKSRIAT
jgi:uncharacterized protein (DUF1778 family)